MRGSLGVVHSLFGPDHLQISIDALNVSNHKYSHWVVTCWIHACSNEDKTEKGHSRLEAESTGMQKGKKD